MCSYWDRRQPTQASSGCVTNRHLSTCHIIAVVTDPCRYSTSRNTYNPYHPLLVCSSISLARVSPLTIYLQAHFHTAGRVLPYCSKTKFTWLIWWRSRSQSSTLLHKALQCEIYISNRSSIPDVTFIDRGISEMLTIDIICWCHLAMLLHAGTTLFFSYTIKLTAP